MTHLPYLIAAYALTGAVVLWLVADAAARTARARTRLRAIDPRAIDARAVDVGEARP